MLRRNRIFRDRIHPFDTGIRWWLNFQEIQIQTRCLLCDCNRLHWQGHCDQQSDWCLKLTPLLQVSLFTRKPSPVVIISEKCVARWSWWVRTALLRALRLSLTFCGERFATPQTLTSAVIRPHTSLYGVCHCLTVGSEHIAHSNATSSVTKTLTLFSAEFAFHISWYVWFPQLSKTRKSRRTCQNQRKFNTADNRLLAADKAPSRHHVFDVVCNALWVKQQIFPI